MAYGATECAVLRWRMVLPAPGQYDHEQRRYRPTRLLCDVRYRAAVYGTKSKTRNCIPGTKCAELATSCICFRGVWCDGKPVEIQGKGQLCYRPTRLLCDA
eukprot:2378158-Rhodomonas_salina.3